MTNAEKPSWEKAPGLNVWRLKIDGVTVAAIIQVGGLATITVEHLTIHVHGNLPLAKSQELAEDMLRSLKKDVSI